MIGALIMVHSDDFGLVLPPKIAPKQVVIVPIGNVEERVNTVYEALRKSNISVYIDNSSKSPGFKFKEAEVNGVPVRIEIGERDLKRNVYTVARRDTQEKQEVSVDEDIVNYVKELMNKIQTNLYQTAKKRRDAMTYEVETKEEMKEIINNHPALGGLQLVIGVVIQPVKFQLKEIGGLKSRCILEDEKPIHKCVACGKEAKHRVVGEFNIKIVKL